MIKLVVDANIFVAAFLRNALTREFLLDESLELLTPEFGLVETQAILQRPAVLKRLGLGIEEFSALWSIITGRVEVVPQELYRPYLAEATGLISDPKDAPYIACALASEAGVWSNDPDFQTERIRNRVLILTTSGLIAKLNR